MRPTKFVLKQSYAKELHNSLYAAAPLVASVNRGTVTKETCITAPMRSYNLGVDENAQPSTCVKKLTGVLHAKTTIRL